MRKVRPAARYASITGTSFFGSSAPTTSANSDIAMGRRIPLPSLTRSVKALKMRSQ